VTAHVILLVFATDSPESLFRASTTVRKYSAARLFSLLTRRDTSGIRKRVRSADHTYPSSSSAVNLIFDLNPHLNPASYRARKQKLWLAELAHMDTMNALLRESKACGLSELFAQAASATAQADVVREPVSPQCVVS